MSDRPRLGVRRNGRQVLVVVDWPPGDRLIDSIPEGGWADAGCPVEPVIALELLARVGESAPEPLASVCKRAVVAVSEAISEAVTDIVTGGQLN